jgi:hypothetical protein
LRQRVFPYFVKKLVGYSIHLSNDFFNAIISRCRQTYICPTVLSPVTTELAIHYLPVLLLPAIGVHKVNKFSLGVVVANDYLWPVFVTGDKIIVDIMKSSGTRCNHGVNKSGYNFSPVTKTLAIIYCRCRLSVNSLLPLSMTPAIDTKL